MSLDYSGFLIGTSLCLCFAEFSQEGGCSATPFQADA